MCVSEGGRRDRDRDGEEKKIEFSMVHHVV